MAATTAAPTVTAKRGKKKATVPMPSGEEIAIDGYGFKVVLLDPETAQAWIDSQQRNRRLKLSMVNYLARQMEMGKWGMTAEAVKFDAEGHMLDGQHRCHAVIRSGVTVPVLVAWGLGAEQQDNMDQGVGRGFEGALSMDEIPYSKEVAAGTRLAYAFEQYGQVHGQRLGKVAIPELRETLERHPHLLEGGKVAAAISSGGIRFPRAVATALFALFAEVDEEDARAFFDKVTTGVGIGVDDPIYLLRKALLNAQGKMARQYQIDNQELSAIAIKAWNKWRRGEKATQLRWRQGGASPEPYPEIDGR